MSDGDGLRAMIGDLSAVRQRLMAKADEIGGQVSALKDRLARKEQSRRVSDHAIVRYLERVFGIDMEKTRADIRALCDESVAFARCDGLWHAKGMVFILSDDGSVVTILGAKEAANYIGRRLVNGERSILMVDHGKPDNDDEQPSERGVVVPVGG